MKYSLENIRLSKKQKRSKLKLITGTSSNSQRKLWEDEAEHLFEALLNSPCPAKEDEISGFYSAIRRKNSRNEISSNDLIEQISSNKNRKNISNQ